MKTTTYYSKEEDAMRKKVTERRRVAKIRKEEIYNSIVTYYTKHGYCPSYQEIAESVNLSPTMVYNYISEMISEGTLETDHPKMGRCLRVPALIISIRE